MDDKQLRSQAELAALMYEDPELKPLMDEWTEKKFPGVHAKVTTQKTTQAAIAEITKAREEFNKDIERERAARVRAQALAEIKTNPDLHIKDEEVPEVEKLMLERGIGRYEDGAYAFRRQNQVAAPSPSRASTWEVPGLGEDGLAGGLDWMKGIIGQHGVNLDLLDKRTKRQRDTILNDYERDPSGAEARWGAPMRQR